MALLKASWAARAGCAAALVGACSGSPAAPSEPGPGAAGAAGAAVAAGAGSAAQAGSLGSGGQGGSAGASAGSAAGGMSAGMAGAAGSAAGGAPEPPGPLVDRTDPQLFSLSFTAKEADASAAQALGKQSAFLDTRAEPVGTLVVFLHGAGEPTTCGGGELGRVVAGWGFHWFAPCYLSNYGIGNCTDDIGGCRLEAFEGKDHHAFIDVAVPDSIERRVTEGLRYLAAENPQGDWLHYLTGDAPNWSKIVVSGSSHGASSAGLIGMYRSVRGVVMLSGPLDLNQAWLEQTPLTPIDRYFGFTHTGDTQHAGHLAAFETLGLPGAPVVIDGATAPFGGSHRFVTSRPPDADGHGSTADGRIDEYLPVWQTMYGP